MARFAFSVPWKTLFLTLSFGAVAVWFRADGDDKAGVWLIAFVAAALLFAVQLVVVNWPTRRDAGHCTKCGYDLQASYDRCPECGTSNPPHPQRHLRRWLHTAMGFDDPERDQKP